MRKGFLLASAAAGSRAPLGVDNLLAATTVRQRREAGAARVLRVECDMVTCSQ